jgi:putative transposase
MEYRCGSHSLYDLKNHVVFCTKYRYKILTGPIAIRAQELVWKIYAANYVNIVSGILSPEHIHLPSDFSSAEYFSIKDSSVH